MKGLLSRNHLAAELLSQLVDSVVDIGLFFLAADGTIQSWNSGAAALTGYDAVQVIGMPLANLVRVDANGQAPFPALGTMATARRWEGAIDLVHARGGYLQVAATLTPLAVAGSAGGFAVQWRALSEAREQADAASRPAEQTLESQDRYRLAILATNDQVYDLDVQTNVVFRSEGFAAVFAGPPETFFSKQWWVDHIHPDDRERAVGTLRAAMDGRDIQWACEYRLRRADGTWAVLQDRAWIGRDANGQARRVVGAIQDITDRKNAEQALRESEERYRVFVDHAADAFFLHDSTTTVVDVNRQACVILGYTREELIGMKPNDFDPTCDEERAMELRRLMNTMGELNFESIHRRRDGSDFPVEIRLRSFWLRGEHHAVALVRDLSAKKQAENALRTSESRLRAIGDNLPGGVIFQYQRWPDGRHLAVYCSQGSERMFGIPAEEIVGSTGYLFGRLDMADAERFEKAIRASMTEGRVLDLEFPIQARNGDWKWLHTRATPRLEPDGSTLWDGVAVDITERRNAEDARRQSDQRYQEIAERQTAILNALPHHIALLDADGLIVEVNEAWRRFAAGNDFKGPDWGVGSNYLAACNQDSGGQVSDVAEGLRQVLRGQLLEFTREYPCHSPTEERWFQQIANPLQEGRAAGAVVMHVNVTARRSLEEQLRQAQKMEAIGRLAGGVAHDFNNVLTVINGYAEILLAKLPEKSSWREALSSMLAAGERGASLTAQLLAFSRKAIVEPKVVDLNQVAEHSSRMLRRLIGENIRLVLFLTPGQVRVKLDPGQLEQVILNLSVNARDAMPQGGVLTIATELVYLSSETLMASGSCAPGHYVQLTVTDTGDGMSEEVKGRIFEPFFTTKGVGKGTGLGLASIYGIVRQANGAIAVHSEVGRGSSFRVFLKAHQEPIPEGISLTNQSVPSGRETILLAEDEEGVRRLVRVVLETQGYRVLEADSGGAAIEAVRAFSGPIHLLLTDVVMPGLGGRALADTLRTARPGLRVLFMSGYTDDQVFRNGVESAEDAFLQKPFASDDLARKVREVLDK